MSNSVDQRIVEMQFDNAQFERGIASTMASLKNLESGLTTVGTASGLEKVQQMAASINFDAASNSATGFAGALETIKGVATNVFDHISSGVGTVMKVLGLVDALTHTGVAALAIHGGWNRATAINQAEFKLQGLLKDSKLVEEAMANASEAVNGTAYGLDSAVTAAANLVASGVGLGDEMTEVLITIADLAGTSGRDFDGVAQIMGAVAAQGKLSGMQIQQFSLSGLNVTAALAKNLNRTEAEIKDMTSKGQIDFETFARVMKEEFGGNAKNANNTFEGSLANVRAALSRTTADLFQYGQKAMVPIFNGLRVSINAVNWALKPLMGTWTDAENKLQKGVLIKGVENITKGIGKALDWWGGTNKTEKTGNFIIDELTGKASASYKSRGPLRFRRIFQEIADAIDAPLKEIGKGSANMTFAIIEMVAGTREVLRLVMEFISPIGMALNDVFGGGTFAQFAKDFRYGFVEPMLESLTSFKASEGYINVVRTAFTLLFTSVKTALGVVVPIIGGTLTLIFNFVSSLGLALGVLFDFIGGVVSLGASTLNIVRGIFSPIIEMFQKAGMDNAANGVITFAEAITSLVTGLRGHAPAFELAVSRFEELRLSAVEFAQGVGERLGQAGEKISGFFQTIRDGLPEWLEDHKRVFQPFYSFIDYMKEGFAEFIGQISTTLSKVNIQVPESFFRIADVFKLIIGSLTGNEEALAYLEELKEAFKIQAGENLERAAESLRILGYHLKAFGKAFKDSSVKAATWAIQQFGKIAQQVAPYVEKAKNAIVYLWNAVKSSFLNANFSLEPIKDFFVNLGLSIKTFVEGIANGDSVFVLFQRLFGNVFESLKALGSDFLPKISGVFEGIGSAIYEKMQGPLKSLADWLGNIRNLIRGISGGLANKFAKIGEAISGIPASVQANGDFKNAGVFSSISGIDVQKVIGEGNGFLDSIAKLVNAIAHPLKTLKSALAGAFDSAGKALGEFVDNIAWERIDSFVSHIAALGMAAGSVNLMVQGGEFLKSAKKFLDGFGGIATAISGVADQLKEVAEAEAKAIKTRAIKNIAISIAILVGSLVVLSMADLDKVREALPIVLGLLVGVSAIVAIFGKLVASNKLSIDGIAKFSTSVTAVGVAIATLAAVTLVLGSVPRGVLIQGLRTVGIFSAILAGFTVLFNKLPPNPNGIGLAFKQMAGAFALLGAAAFVLGALPKSSMDRGLGIVAAFTVGLLVVMKLLSKIDTTRLQASVHGLVEIAGAVALLGAAAFVLGRLSVPQLAKGVGAVVVLLAAVSGMIIAFEKFDVRTVAKTTSSVLLLSLSIAMLAGAVSGLALMSKLGADVWGAVGAMTALMAMLAVLSGAIQNSQRGLNSSALGLVALALALTVLTGALVALSLVNKVADIGPAVIALIGVMVGLGYAVKTLSSSTTNISKATGLLTSMTVAIGVISVALMGLAIVAKDGTLWEGLGALTVAVAAFVGALILLGAVSSTPIGDGLMKFGAVLIKIGAAFALFGVSVLLLAAGALTFVNAMEKMAAIGPDAADAVVEAIKRLGRGLWDAKTDIALGIEGIGYGIIMGLLGLLPMALAALLTFIGQLIGVLVLAAPIIGEGAVIVAEGLVKGLADGIREHGGEVLKALGELFLSIVEGIGGIFSAGINKFNEWLYETTHGIMGAKPVVEEEAKGVGEAAEQGLDQGFNGDQVIKDKMDGTSQYLQNFDGYGLMSGVTGQFAQGAKDAAQNFDFMKTLGIDSKTFGGTLGDLAKIAKDKGVELPEYLQAGAEEGATSATPLDQLIDSSGMLNVSAIDDLYASAGISGVDSYANAAEGQMATVDLTGFLSGTQALNQDTINAQFNEAGTNAATSFTDSFAESLSIDGSGPAEKAAKAMEMTDTFSKSGKANAAAAVKGMQDGLKTFPDLSKKAAEKATKAISGQKEPARKGAKELGKALSDGIALGLNSSYSNVEKACDKIIKQIDKVLRKKALIKSPSRMTAEIGRYLVEGIMVGMEDTQHALAQTSEGVMSESLSVLSAQAAYMSELLDGIDGQPVIRPVLDLTDYNAGLAQMAMLDTPYSTLSAQLSGSRIFSSTQPQPASPAAGATVTINLNYDAGADANQMVMDIARGLSTQLAMEGV